MELNSPQSNKFIEPIPNKIVLIKVIDQNFYEGRLIFNNITSHYVVYRIFNDRSILYSISPNIFFIKPYEKFTINIKRFEKVMYI